MNKLTFLFTLHSEHKSVYFFIELIKDIKDKVDVLFSFDNKQEEVDNEIIKFIEKNGFKYYIAGKNEGKLSLVIKSSFLIESDFFKIIDQDDTMYLKEINGLIENLKYFDKRDLIKHKALKIRKKGNEKIFFQSLNQEIIEKQKSKGKNVFYAQQTNCDTIYPTEVIREMKDYSLTRQNFHNDVLLSNFCIATGSRLKKINNSFYIQFHAKGQTSNYNPERANCTLELYNNYKKVNLINKNFKVNRLMWKMKISHKSFIASFTKWYLKNEEKKNGKILYKETTNILNELWKK